MSKVNVVKIPDESIDHSISRPADFPRMPRMYLELLENKEKVKPTLMNQEYDPNDAETIASYASGHADATRLPDDNMETIDEEDDADNVSEVTLSEKGSDDSISVAESGVSEEEHNKYDSEKDSDDESSNVSVLSG